MVIRDDWFWSAPELIIEVFSNAENKRRKEEKVEDYASIGVPEVWLVSPEAEIVEVRLLKDPGRRRTPALPLPRRLHPHFHHLAGLTRLQQSAVFQ